MKTKQTCISHKCEICGKELYPAFSRWFQFVFIAIVLSAMIFTGWIQEKRLEKIYAKSDCYQKDYIINNEQQQIYSIREIECKNLNQ